MRTPMLVACLLVSAACGAAMKSPMAAPSAPPSAIAAGGAAGPSSPIATELPEQLVIEGTVTLVVDEVKDVLPALHARVAELGGRVIDESVTGAENTWSAHVKLRVPPAQVEPVLAFLAARGEITDKHITASDVSRQLFDQDIALKNLHTTLDRLTQLMAQGGLKIDDVLRVEQEMTRIRGEIEQLEGDQRFLKDRVALATLDVTMSRRAGEVHVAAAKAYPGARAVALVLLDPGKRARTRFGGGFVLHTLLRSMSLEVDLFQNEPDASGGSSSMSVLATTGGAAYSDFLGRGQRRFVNPYLGFRLGYGYLDGTSRFVAQGEAGVELVKTKYALIDADVRLTGLIGKQSDAGVVAGVGAVFAF